MFFAVEHTARCTTPEEVTVFKELIDFCDNIDDCDICCFRHICSDYKFIFTQEPFRLKDFLKDLLTELEAE